MNTIEDIELLVRLRFLPITLTEEYVSQFPDVLLKRYTEIFDMITGDHLGAHQYYSTSPTLNLFNFLHGVQSYDLEGLVVKDLLDYYYTEELIRLYSSV